MAIIFIGLGSNEGNSFQILSDAYLDLKKNVGYLIASSSIYETAPWGFESKNSFLNAVLKFETNHTPEEILNILQYLETKAGRKRNESENYTDRTLDLDLLYYDNVLSDKEELVLPHPRISERLFVLWPMVEIDAEWIDARHQKSMKQLLDETVDISAIKKSSKLNFNQC
jgi:2-amino-4-hydroxy-6-hydroxymethyldihydropteridine diphosphokinase